MARIKGHQDFGTAHFAQAIIAEVLESGDYLRHLEIVRPDYQEKMLFMDSCLRAHGFAAAGWKWTKPSGGLLMWMQAPPETGCGYFIPNPPPPGVLIRMRSPGRARRWNLPPTASGIPSAPIQNCLPDAPGMPPFRPCGAWTRR